MLHVDMIIFHVGCRSLPCDNVINKKGGWIRIAKKKEIRIELTKKYHRFTIHPHM